MNKIGIIGAMDEEVSRLKEKMEVSKIETKAGMEFFQGVLAGKEVVVVRSGIGKVNAGICTQILADDFSVDAVINTGIAGALHKDINIGDIVLSEDALQHDMDATGFGYEPGVIPRMEESVFKGNSTLLEIAKEVNETRNPDITTFTGRIVSGDQFISDREKKEYLIKQFAGFCTEMEGAAIAQVCYLNEIPFLIIRAISDKADQSATMDYKEFEEKAIEHTVKLVVGMMEAISCR